MDCVLDMRVNCIRLRVTTEGEENIRMKWVPLVMLLSIGAAASAQSPLPPERPIYLTTDIGEVPITGDKLRISVMATLSNNEVSSSIQITQVNRGSILRLNPAEAGSLTTLLDDGLDSLARGVGIGILWTVPKIGLSVAGATGAANGGLMAQFIILFPLWAPFAVHWARKRSLHAAQSS